MSKIWTYRFTHRAVLISSLYENLSITQNLPYLRQSSVKCLEKTVDCCPQSDASDGIEQPASLFLVLYSILCPQGKPWSATDDTAEHTHDCFTCLLLNQEHGVNNERSQSIQSVRHSKRTPDVAHSKRPWCAKRACFSRKARSWQSNTVTV